MIPPSPAELRNFLLSNMKTPVAVSYTHLILWYNSRVLRGYSEFFLPSVNAIWPKTKTWKHPGSVHKFYDIMVALRMYKHLVPYPAAGGGICPLGKPKNSGSACKLCDIFVTEKSLSEWMTVFYRPSCNSTVWPCTVSYTHLDVYKRQPGGKRHPYFVRYAGSCS